MIARRSWVSGRVQGVFYRASTQSKARELSVHGYAKNLADGRVEVFAVGEAEAVAALIAWLWEGPPSAAVSNVETIDVTLESLGLLPQQFVTS